MEPRRIDLGDILGVRRGVFARDARVTPTDWPELDALLPDGGFTPGVVELAAPHGLGGGSSVTLAFMRAVQTRSRHAWCAWVEPLASSQEGGHLYAPAVVQAGVELRRLLVARVPARSSKRARDMISRTAMKLAVSGGFACIAVNGTTFDETAVRKFAMSAEEHGSTVCLLTDSLVTHAPWPVTLRLDLLRTVEGISLRITKDKRGRAGASGTVPFPFARKRETDREMPRMAQAV